MSEKLLHAIVKLFAVLAKERITDEERSNIKEFLLLHLNREATREYMKLFDSFCSEKIKASAGDLEGMNPDDETLEFVGEWVLINEISDQINTALTHQQKVVLVEKIVELFLRDKQFSERQSNLIYHLGELIKIEQTVINELSGFVLYQHGDSFKSENALFISAKSPHKAVKHIVNENLDGSIVFLRIPTDEVYFVKYSGKNNLIFNGVPMSNGSIYVFPTGSSIKGEAITSMYYSDVVNQFVQNQVTGRITFNAENIHYRFLDGDQGIKGVNISEEGGKLVGIMGASGSGKTTLLNILNGTESPDEGKVMINGVDLHKEKSQARGVIGYVPQDDFLIEELSVYENLMYAARLCFRDKSEAQLDDLVKKILRNLGLMEIRALKVGSPLDKTISGGQRKRLNIGLELLREPTVLFVDEPTSGLSSRDSENIMDLLKELSLRGKMVFVVIHQPSSDIYKMFDRLLIMDVGGFPIYYGNPIEAVVHFKETVNMVNSDHGACHECGNINPEQIFSIIETKVVNEFGRFTEHRKVSPQQWNEIYLNKFCQSRLEPSNEKLKATHQVPNWLGQLKVFFSRDLFSKLKNAQYIFINLWEAPVLAIFLASLVRYNSGEGDYTYFSNNNIPVFLFVSVVVALFMGLTVSAKEIIKDRKILKREKFLQLSRSSYLLAKISILFGISAIQTGLYVFFACWILEIQGEWFTFWLVLFSVSAVANLMGLNISSAFKTTITVYILIPILLIPQLILSGVVVNFDRFNENFANKERVPIIGDTMASRWSFEALMVDFFVHNDFQRQFYDYEKVESTSRYYNLYYMDAMTTRLSELARALKDGSIDNDASAQKMKIVRNEFKHLLDDLGYDFFPQFELLNTKDFNLEVFEAALNYLVAVQQVYNNRRDVALADKDSLIQQLQASGQYDILRHNYHNDELSAQVRDSYSTQKIVEGKQELIRKYEPIYSDPKPRFFLDYRTSFYSAEKHFAGMYFPTLQFNLMVIWVMVFLMYFTLYFEIPERFITFFGRLTRW
jgi:ABC-type multidrug transport system ATPase subunit